MNPNGSTPAPDQSQQQPQIVEQPGQPAWNTQPGQLGSGFVANPAQYAQGQTIPPAGYYGVPGTAPAGPMPDTTLPPRGPAPNSVPIQGTYDPTTGQFTPSQPLNPYGTPPSQPLYTSSPQWPAAGPASVLLTASVTKKSGVPWRIVTVVASALVILAIAGGGFVFVSAQNRAAHLAASKAADALCAHLVAKDYGSVYSDMSSAAQSQYSSTQFGQLMTTLDQIEGNITSCRQTPGAYSYKSGSKVATTALAISRASFGSLSGTLSLTKNGGAWTIEGLGASLLGVNLAAMYAVDKYCSALQSQRYSDLVTFIGSGDGAHMSVIEFQENARLQDLFDGLVTECKVTAIAPGNTDSMSTMTLSVSRANSQGASGQVTLSNQFGTWSLAGAGPAALGNDYRPVLIGDQFCLDLQNSDLASAYDLFDSAFQERYSQASVQSDFNVAENSFICTTPDISTFASANSQASYVVDVNVQNRGGNQSPSKWYVTLYFALQGESWMLDGYSYY